MIWLWCRVWGRTVKNWLVVLMSEDTLMTMGRGWMRFLLRLLKISGARSVKSEDTMMTMGRWKAWWLVGRPGMGGRRPLTSAEQDH